ncbi:hypothetical protein EHM92_01530 [bacterium]|nr:MAG: hypothetical protein EHM92_01530 [bacterium]
MEEYTEYTKKLIDLIRELNVGIAFSAFGSESGCMDYNQRITGPCDFGPKLEAWDTVHAALLKIEWGKKRLNSVEWSRYSVWERSGELSYEPAHPEPDQSRPTYFVWKNLRLRAEKEKDFIETGRQVRAFLEKKNIERGYNVFRNLIGYEGPLYTVIFPGRDPVESQAWLQQTGRNLAFGLLPFLPQLMASVEQTADFEGRAMPELSLVSG